MEPIILSDTSLVAFLKHKNYTITPQFSPEDKHQVEFIIEGNPKEIEFVIQCYYKNEMAGIFEYTKCLKEVKTMMYSMKRAKN